MTNDSVAGFYPPWLKLPVVTWLLLEGHADLSDQRRRVVLGPDQYQAQLVHQAHWWTQSGPEFWWEPAPGRVLAFP